MSELSHIDSGNRPTMVDVSDKAATERRAHARAIVEFPPSLALRLADGDIRTAKGPVFATAIPLSTSSFFISLSSSASPKPSAAPRRC